MDASDTQVDDRIPSALPSVPAVINYVKGSHDEVLRFKLDADWTGADPEPRTVRIHNAAEAVDPPTLDREGFGLYAHEYDTVDFSDMKQIQEVWQPSVRRLLKRATGAAHAITWASNVRFSERSPRSTSTPVSAPARRVHSDFALNFDPSEFGYPEFVQQLEAVLAQIGKKAPDRWRAFNVWQPLTPPPYDTPLALCDARSVELADTIEGNAEAMAGGHGIDVEFPLYKANTEHRWYYYPNMTPDQALVFSGHDPNGGPIRRAVAHTAFDDPTCPTGAPPRNSIEVRTLVIFDE